MLQKRLCGFSMVIMYILWYSGCSLLENLTAEGLHLQNPTDNPKHQVWKCKTNMLYVAGLHNNVKHVCELFCILHYSGQHQQQWLWAAHIQPQLVQLVSGEDYIVYHCNKIRYFIVLVRQSLLYTLCVCYRTGRANTRQLSSLTSKSSGTVISGGEKW